MTGWLPQRHDIMWIMKNTVCAVSACEQRARAKGWCYKHYSRYLRHGDPAVTLRGENMSLDGRSRKCTGCREIKPIDRFIPRERRGTVQWSKCKPCINATNRDRYGRDGSKMKRATRKNLLKKFGLTPEEYEQMAARQNGACSICLKAEVNGKRLSVDHDHRTGATRELLCFQCNSSLARIEDPIWFARASAYLRKHERPQFAN